MIVAGLLTPKFIFTCANPECRCELQMAAPPLVALPQGDPPPVPTCLCGSSMIRSTEMSI